MAENVAKGEEKVNEVELTAEGKDQPQSEAASPSKSETTAALQHLVQGKRHLLVRDVHSAVNSLQEACRLLAEQYGETADPCGEAYFVYGKALLELSRIETGVLGNALEGESADGDEDEDADSEENEPDGVEADAGEADAASAEGEGGDSDTVSADDGKEADTSQDCDTEEGEEGAKQEGDEDDEVSNIQLAWEVLELAKIIFTRQATDRPSDLKLSEVYLKLGEVSIEAENYTQAVEDLANCLQIQKKHLEPDDRLVAETHYHMGVAHSLANEYTEAIASLQASVDTILARIQRLNKQIVARHQGEKIEHADPFYKEETEIKELEDLLPDIREKIADMRDMKLEAQKKITQLFAAGGAGPSTSAPISPVKAMMTSRPGTVTSSESAGEQKEVRSIGHLVKRKRQSGEPAEDESKRPKQENGHAETNGHADPLTSGDNAT